MFIRYVTDSFDQLVSTSIDIDNRLYERRMERKYDYQGEMQFDSRLNNYRPLKGKGRTLYRRDPDVIEIDNI